MIKNVLRYPGGKSKAIDIIIPLIPTGISEFREPMVGGGSVSLVVKQLFPDVKVKINDLNYDLICFWRVLRDKPNELIEEVEKIKKCYQDGRTLYNELVEKEDGSEFERAVRFFVLNRITFSGTVDSGGYSQHAFEKRFTESAIEKLRKASAIIKDFEITHGDYEKLLFEGGKDVFIFLDPPYYSTTKSRLYGKNGDLHLTFDHKRFAENMRKCKHLWLITYDDSEEIRELFSFAYIYEWELQYGMNNYKQPTARKGKELFITNYMIKNLKSKNRSLQLSIFDFI
ncbi:DNA adenine methylase [Fervidobacterium sp.]|uniref:DNA adenine methylase n=1 Tax=Fervidobacterium sp. TaxID=1871331 RepID=UPI0030D7E4FC